MAAMGLLAAGALVFPDGPWRLAGGPQSFQFHMVAGGIHRVPETIMAIGSQFPVQRVDSTLARERLGWAPRWTFEEALEETLAWYRAHLAGLENGAGVPDEPALPAGKRAAGRLGRAA